MIVLVINLNQLIQYYNKKKLRLNRISMTSQGRYRIVIKYYSIDISLLIFNYCYFYILV